MNPSTATAQEAAKNRRLLLAAAAMLLLAAGIVGGLSRLQSQAVPMTLEEHTARRNELLNDPAMLAECQAQANSLRKEWQPWAEEHAGLLKAMLDARPDDQAAMMAVWDALPSRGLRGITEKDVGLKGAADAAIIARPRSGLGCAWLPAEKTYDRARLAAAPRWLRLLKIKQRVAKMQPDFATWRDIKITESFNLGQRRFSLWASGRITQGGLIDNPDRTPGSRASIVGPDAELVPPYDFLR